MRYHLFQKFFGKMVKIKETSFLSIRGIILMFGNCIPDLVYIQKGLERREPISQVHYNAFMEHLLGKITDLSFKDCANLHIAWHGWGLG